MTGKWQFVGAVALAGVFAARGAQAEVKLKLYGQVNRAVLYADDGNDSKVYFVDNKNSSTRFGLDAKGTVDGSDLVFGSKLEAEIASNSSTDVNQELERTSPVTFNERHMDFWVEGGFGRFSIGQGNMASNETSEVDLSGTTVIGYSSVEDLAGGIYFFNNAKNSLIDTPAVPATPTTPEKAAKYNPKVKDVFDNFDGLSRDDRVRYDTPKFGGFQASTSVTSLNAWDVALRYNADFGGTKLAAAAAYASMGDGTKVAGGDPVTQVNGSVSVLMPFGLSVTGAYGQQSLDDAARKDDPMFWYAKLGYTAKLLFQGSTTFAVDYSASNDVKADKDEATTMGAFVVQRFDNYGTELYLGYRTYALDRTAKDFADVSALMGGARVKF
jgi:hypothetical protein